MKKPTIGVAMIVKNEEAMLSSCLESIKGVDGIVICDTGSTDATVKIAQKYTDEVYTDYKWEDSFAKARNHSKSKVPKDIDWILIIDADEVLSGSIESLREELSKLAEDVGFVTTQVQSTSGGAEHKFPRVHRNWDSINWYGAGHNYLRCDNSSKSVHTDSVKIVYGHSPAHKLDPDRTYRILKKAIKEDPSLVRERFYFGKECYSRKKYTEAIESFDSYVGLSKYIAERNDAYLLKARCLAALKKYDEACDSAWQALKYNANFKEVLEFIGNHMDPINKERWHSFAGLADNRNVLFVRSQAKPLVVGKDIKLQRVEKDSSYYDRLFETADFTRYENIYKRIGDLVGEKKVLDIGCGPATLSSHIKNYSGFDFAENTIKKAKDKGSDVYVGNALDKDSYKEADIYIATEVLEHIEKDVEIFKNIPKGKEFIVTVPSFMCESHLRTYTPESFKERYKGLIEIEEIRFFNLVDKMWVESEEMGDTFILLIGGSCV